MDIRGTGVSTTGRRAVALALLLCLSGCGAGGVGGGQNPDPVVQDFPIAYVKRTIPAENPDGVVNPDVRDLLRFNAGGDLYLRDRAIAGSPERNISFPVTGGLGDVRDVEVSYDGSKILFALRLPEIENADPEDQPTWNIWEYEVESGQLRRIIASDITAEAGQDVAPHYLPDGRIVFASTRQRQARALLLDEGKPQFGALDEDLNEEALVLHVMRDDGSDLKQISFNASHDLDPTVLASGEVLFSRWDNAAGSAMHLYTVRPDGTELKLRYGAHSHATGTDGGSVQFLQPREMSDGRILSLIRPFTNTQGGGDLVLIDSANYVDNTTPTYPNLNILAGPAQTPATRNAVNTNPGPSAAGRYGSAYPLDANRLLVTWSECRLLEGVVIVPCTPERLQNPAAVEAPPLYGVFIYNMSSHTQLPVMAPREGVLYSDAVAVQPRPLANVLFDRQPGIDLDGALAEQNAGLLHIRSVYDVDGTDTGPITTLRDPALTAAAQRPARFLRVIKAVGIPDDNVRDFANTAFGRSAAQLMREIVGYKAIEPDGSVMLKVPADVPLAIEVLDAQGRRIGSRHNNWLQLRAGETVTCAGCHDHASGRSHGRGDVPSVNPGAPTTGLPFPNTVASLWADMGETMAAVRARISCMSDCAALEPSLDLVFDDVWTDPAVRAPDASFAYRYLDLATPAPTSAACQLAWSYLCRITVHYPSHIHPLWAVNRQVLDTDGVTVLQDHTCTACHSDRDAMGAARLPAGQLDLGDGASSDEPDHLKSYRELLFDDNEQELVGGVLQDVVVQATDANGAPLYQTDADGELVLDADGQPIPVLTTVTVSPSMSTAGARFGRFMAKFDAGGTHAGYLSAAELKLLAEWLDIGAQYYNDPFAAPVQ